MACDNGDAIMAEVCRVIERMHLPYSMGSADLIIKSLPIEMQTAEAKTLVRMLCNSEMEGRL